MSKRQVKVCDLPIMKAHCKTCPFRPNEWGFFTDMELANAVIQRTLFQAQQICHGTEGPNREWRNRCKGAYDHNKEIYDRMGIPDLDKTLNNPEKCICIKGTY